MRVLNKCNWKHLNKIFLFTNELGDSSIEFLSYSDWPLLDMINICNIVIKSNCLTKMGF